jgi:hypothetical protein
MNEWLGLIGALAGTAIGGFVTYKVANQQHSFERAAENERRLITACESIHELLSAIASQASTYNVGVLSDLGYNSPLKGDILKEKVQLDRLRMFVNFYAPSLSTDIKAISEQFNIVSLAVANVLCEKKRNDEWKSKTIESAVFAYQPESRIKRTLFSGHSQIFQEQPVSGY